MMHSPMFSPLQNMTISNITSLGVNASAITESPPAVTITGAGALDKGALIRGSIVFLVMSLLFICYILIRKRRSGVGVRGSANARVNQYNMVSSVDDDGDDETEDTLHSDDDGMCDDRQEDLLFDASSRTSRKGRNALPS